MSVFIIAALPRSMTAWASCLLTQGEVFCQHELSAKLPVEQIPDELETQDARHSGNADPGILFYWKELYDLMPKATWVYIKRDLTDSFRALAAAARVAPDFLVNVYDAMKTQLELFMEEVQPEVFDWKYLQQPKGAQALWDCVAPDVPLPSAHLRKMMTLRVEQDPAIYRALLKSFAPTM